MARRSRTRKGKKSKPAKAQVRAGKKKYGLRALAEPVAAKRVRAKKKEPIKQSQAEKPVRNRGPGKAERTWDANYARAEEYLKVEGPDWWLGMTGRDKSFGAWLQTQRYNRKIGRLRHDREKRLEKIGFVWDTMEAVWDLRFDSLVRHIRTAGEVWWKSLPESDRQLESWCDTQRRTRKHGELSEERRSRLDSIGFVWRVLDAMWNQRFEELRFVLKDSPHGWVSRENASEELVMWVFTQRRKHLAGEIDADRATRLRGIGFCWDGRQARSDEIWERHFTILSAYRESSGNANPGPRDDAECFHWLASQRRVWDLLPGGRRERLVALGVSRQAPPDQIPRRSASPHAPDWDGFLNGAADFRKRFGHLRIVGDRESAEFPGLLNFAAKLRSGLLEPDDAQYAELERLGFVWDIRAARAQEFFDTRFAELVEYKREHGDCNVSQLSEIYRALGQWVNRLRLTRDELDPGQRGRLEAIGFVWELKREWMEGQWEIRFRELLEYKEAKGHCLVPQVCQDWHTLSRWVSRMRQTRDKLGEGRIRRLDEVGFIWDAKAAECAETEEMRYRELADFVGEHGHARVTRGSDPTGGVLNGWIVRQREKKKKGKMDPGFAVRLDELGFVWVTRGGGSR